MDVREQWVTRDADRFGPVLVAERAVRADTQHLGIRRLEVRRAPVEGGHAGGSARSPVERIEEDYDRLAAKISQAHFLEPDGLQREVRGWIPDTNRLDVAHGVVPSF